MLEKETSPADLRLIESEARYRAVIDTASDMIQSVRPDGTFEFVNDAWKTTLGYTDEDLATTTVFEIIHPDFMDHCMGDFMRTLNGENVDYLETRFVTKDGQMLPVEGSIVPRFLGEEVVATHGFFRDISERIRARELEELTAKLELEERARYLEKMAALGKLSAGLAHELNNPAAAMQRAGDGLEETIQRRDAAMRKLAGASLGPEDWQALTEILGRVQPTHLDPVALSLSEAAIETWLEERGVERAWELAPACAEAGITIDDLAAISAQVPATSLSDALAWINETLVLRESTGIIVDSCHRIADLVLAIKGYSHMDRASVYDADIHDGLENTLIILAHRLRDVEVRREYDRAIPSIRMYGNTLNQVWTNILDNAIDAMGDRGRITIRTQTAGDQVLVEIEDDGCGIPAEALPRIFEPFYTSKPQGQGVGLGLDTAWRIVTAEYGGAISATSQPGRTVFQISLPLTPPPRSDDVVA